VTPNQRNADAEGRIEARVYEKCLRVFDVAAARYPTSAALCEVRSIFSTLMLAADPRPAPPPPTKPAKIPIYIPKKAVSPGAKTPGRKATLQAGASTLSHLSIAERKQKMLDLWAEGRMSAAGIADRLGLKRGSVSAWIKFARDAGDPRAAKRYGK
jgi:DNA-binding CsgD family transcriptional regulator